VRALQWLAQREHSHLELRDKLLRLLQRSARSAPGDADAADMAEAGTIDATAAFDPAAEVDAVLQWLTEHGHLSDARFTESRVHARQARYGNRRIQQELQQHGVRLDVDARQLLQQTELGRAREVWRRKYGAPAPDAAGRLRQMRFLVGRGFSMDVIRQVLQAGDGARAGVDAEAD
jgi:regulatory protein